MPLTVRSNGSGSSNIIQSSWFNDYHDLLTGVMQDQEVTIKNLLILNAIGTAPSSAAGGSAVSGTGLGIGLYVYAYTYANADGETTISPTNNITTTSGNQKVNLTGVTVGPTGTTKRNIYRTVVGGGTVFKLVASINDNSTTTFSDTTADGSLGVTAPVLPTFGGAVFMRDSSGTTRLTLASDGTIVPNRAGQVVNGSVSGTASFFTPIWGPAFKLGMVVFANYQNASNAQFNLPSTFARGLYIMGDMGSTTPSNQWILNGTNISSTAITGLASGGGSGTAVTSFHQNTIGSIISTVGQIIIAATSGLTVNSGLFFVGV